MRRIAIGFSIILILLVVFVGTSFSRVNSQSEPDDEGFTIQAAPGSFSEDDNTINLTARQIRPDSGIEMILERRLQEDPNAIHYVILQTENEPTPLKLSQLQQDGVRLLRPLGNGNAYLAAVPGTILTSQSRETTIRWMGQIQPGDAFPDGSPLGYTLDVNTSGQGQVKFSPSHDLYPWDTSVMLLATPDEGWAFASWSGSIGGTNSEQTIRIDGNKSVTAIFFQPAPSGQPPAQTQPPTQLQPPAQIQPPTQQPQPPAQIQPPTQQPQPPANQPGPSQPPKEPHPTLPDPWACDYRVQYGDTIRKIADTHRISIGILRHINHIEPHVPLWVGQCLKIPAPGTEPYPQQPPPTTTPAKPGWCNYTVIRGDTLSELAKKFGVPMKELMRLNHISDPNLICIGQCLYIPQ